MLKHQERNDALGRSGERAPQGNAKLEESGRKMKEIKSEIPPGIQEAPFIMHCGWHGATAPRRLLASVEDLSE